VKIIQKIKKMNREEILEVADILAGAAFVFSGFIFFLLITPK
jgi:hypothetical protein